MSSANIIEIKNVSKEYDGFPNISSPEDLMTLANGGKVESRIKKETNEDD